MIKLVTKDNFINKIWSPRQSDHFEIAAATLLMTVKLASKSGKRYWNTASLDQSPRIFIVASGILHISSQVAIPFLRLWVEQLSKPGHASHRDFSRDLSFAGVKQVKEPCWFRNENSGALMGADALVMKFRIAVTGHKTWPFMKGKPLGVFVLHARLSWTDGLREQNPDLLTSSPFWGQHIDHKHYWPVTYQRNHTGVQPRSICHWEYSDLISYAWAKDEMAALGIWK